MEIAEIREQIRELINHKNDCDEAYGVKFYRPYSMSKEDYECIEALLNEFDIALAMKKTAYDNGFREGYGIGSVQGFRDGVGHAMAHYISHDYKPLSEDRGEKDE